MNGRPENFRSSDQRGSGQGKRAVSGPAGDRRAGGQGRHPTRDADYGPPSLRAAGTGATWIKALTVCALLVIAVAATFGQTVQHEFIVCDDEPYVYGNPNVATGLTPANVARSMTSLSRGQLASAHLDVAHARRKHVRDSLRDTTVRERPRGRGRPTALDSSWSRRTSSYQRDVARP